MSGFARAIMLLLLVAFAAGPVVQAVTNTSMLIEMASSGDAMDSSGTSNCDACPGEEGQAADCQFDCISSSHGVLPRQITLLVPERASYDRPLVQQVIGTKVPIDPDPPRTLLS